MADNRFPHFNLYIIYFQDRSRYRDSYDENTNGGNSVYTRGYAPWQWGYWASDNMAYAAQDDAFYTIQDDRSRSRGHFAGNMYDNAGYHGYKHGRSAGGSYKLKTRKIFYTALLVCNIINYKKIQLPPDSDKIKNISH